MLANDIRPSTSPWNAPTILVRKKNGATQIVCDYRELNKVTKKDTYQLPHVKDVLDKMHGAVYWSTLDAASAYWATPLRETKKRRLFQYNGENTNLMSRLSDHMDDIVVFSPTWPSHLESLRKVFQRLREASIRLKASKCVIGSNKVEFLGFELPNVGIHLQRRFTEAINNFRKPSNRKEVRRFLGLAGFYRDFVTGKRLGDL